ncbi:MAG: glycosyltransferase [Balneolaceae bacterium]|nr:glycosyltransferase [Balneolaceae bacterium]
MSAYFILAVISLYAMRSYLRKNSNEYFEDLLRSPLAPKVSIIAPAFNEQLSIVENIRSLLSLHYNKYDIIIVNDGSKDNTLQLMIDAYDLEIVEEEPTSELAHKPVNNVYRSKKRAYRKLVVIDKENGGKADALNAGITYSDAELIACVDVDCVIEDDALLRMVKPYLSANDHKVIAVGGVIRIANNCEIKNGRLIKVRLAKNWLATFQTLEYIRAFLLGRMAWAHLDGLLIISGAFGMFDRKLVIKVGGYDHKTVGEDMELVVRLRKYMAEKEAPYKVAYVPDPLCWTEAPEDLSTFIRQRNRWTRGTIETLSFHKEIFLRPKFGLMGILSYPFWFVFEWLAPLIEFFGLFYFIVIASLGLVYWSHFFLLILLVYVFAVLISWFALLMEETTYREYAQGGALLKLMFFALLEPLIYHPITVWGAVKGNIDKFILKKNSWGAQQRKGFSKTGKT